MKSLFSKTTATVLLATGVVTGGMVSSANAAGFITATCNVTNITDGSGAAADACAGGFAGNDSIGEMNEKNIFGIDTWESQSKIEDNNGWSNSLFEIIDPTSEFTSGEIQFKETIDSQFAFVLKAGNFWSAYSFDGVTTGDIFNFDTIGVAEKANGRGGSPALSHASIYFHESDSNPQEIPEPASVLSLLALGAMGTSSLLKHKSQ